jgi:hypothetical protein
MTKPTMAQQIGGEKQMNFLTFHEVSARTGGVPGTQRGRRRAAAVDLATAPGRRSFAERIQPARVRRARRGR